MLYNFLPHHVKEAAEDLLEFRSDELAVENLVPVVHNIAKRLDVTTDTDERNSLNRLRIELLEHLRGIAEIRSCIRNSGNHLPPLVFFVDYRTLGGCKHCHTAFLTRKDAQSYVDAKSNADPDRTFFIREEPT